MEVATKSKIVQDQQTRNRQQADMYKTKRDEEHVEGLVEKPLREQLGMR